MKNKRIIIVVASCLMLLAYFAMPYANIKVSSFLMSDELSFTQFDDLKDADTILDFLLSLLILLSPLYLLLDVFRENLQEIVPIVKKIIISEKVTLLLPLILIVFQRLYVESIIPAFNEIIEAYSEGYADFSIEYGSGFYLYLVAAIVVAVLPWVKQSLLEEEKKEEEYKS